jgi:solute carrier family 13 (sodium-dependent dicarboxylate transporter), member 2/3/5
MVTGNAGASPASSFLENPNSRVVIVGQLLCILVPLAFWVAPLPLEPITKHCFAILAFMLVAWITRAMDYAVAGLIGCFLFWTLGIVQFSVAFSGFANDTAWFLFGAMLLGMVAVKSTIARRIAYFILLRVGVSYPRILLGLIVTDFLLTFIIPSGIARVAIMASIALGVAEAYNSSRGDNVLRGMFVVLSYTATIFDKMIIGGASSITARGLLEKLTGVEVLWSYWFIAFLPSGVITILAAWGLTLKIYPPEKLAFEGGAEYLREEIAKMGSLSALEKRSALLMTAAVLLWLTDFLHHISPAVIGLGVGLFALLPRIGVLEVEDMKRLNYLPVFFVATAVSLGAVLGATNGLDVLTRSMFTWMPSSTANIITTTIIMYWTAFVYHLLLASEISMLGTSIPLVVAFAKTHSFNPLLLGMIWTFAAGGKLFAYQSAVLIVGYSYGYFAARDLAVLGGALTLVEFVVLLVLVSWYWPLIGLQ